MTFEEWVEKNIDPPPCSEEEYLYLISLDDEVSSRERETIRKYKMHLGVVHFARFIWNSSRENIGKELENSWDEGFKYGYSSCRDGKPLEKDFKHPCNPHRKEKT